MHSAAPLLIAFWLLAYAAPSWVVLRFELDRDRIVREDCVQRGVPLAERTCFGQCHLVKQLNELEEEEQQGAPAGNTLKWEPQALPFVKLSMAPQGSVHVTAERQLVAMCLLDGHPFAIDGVPWG